MKEETRIELKDGRKITIDAREDFVSLKMDGHFVFYC